MSLSIWFALLSARVSAFFGLGLVTRTNCLNWLTRLILVGSWSGFLQNLSPSLSYQSLVHAESEERKATREKRAMRAYGVRVVQRARKDRLANLLL